MQWGAGFCAGFIPGWSLILRPGDRNFARSHAPERMKNRIICPGRLLTHQADDRKEFREFFEFLRRKRRNILGHLSRLIGARLWLAVHWAYYQQEKLLFTRPADRKSTRLN